MKSTSVSLIRTTLLALFCSYVAQFNSENMSVYAQYTSPPNCGASCYSERARQRDMEWVRGSTEYNSRINDKSQGMSSVISVVILGGIGFGVYYWMKKSKSKD